MDKSFFFIFFLKPSLYFESCSDSKADLNGRQPQWKMTSMKDNLNGRQPWWKIISMEDDLNGRRARGKMTSMEEHINGSWPQWKSYTKQKTLACQASKFCTELGPAQPQLVSPIIINYLYNSLETRGGLVFKYPLCVSGLFQQQTDVILTSKSIKFPE